MQPMLATPAAGPREIPSGDSWTHEVKWDGMRVIAEYRHGRLRLSSRRGNAVTDAFPELANDDLPENVVLDGEVVSLADGRPSFGALASRIHVRERGRAAVLASAAPVTFMVFDVLRLAGGNLTDQPLSGRRAQLEALDLPSTSPRWQVPPSYPDGEVLLAATRAQGLEGIVSKRWSSKYYPGRRTPDWIKFAHRQVITAAIVGWLPQVDRADVLGAVWLALPDGNGGWRTLGRCGAGLVGPAGKELLELISARPVRSSPYAEAPVDPDLWRTHWVEPRVLIDVRYLGSDDSGRLRQPVYRGVRTDLSVADLLDQHAPVAGEEL